MLKRIYNKAFSIVDSVIGKVHLFLEQKKVLNAIPYTIYGKIDNKVFVNHKYPLNYEVQDKLLFDHCTNYDTQQQTIYQLRNVNVSERGIFFKKFNNCGHSFQFKIFNTFGNLKL